MYEENGMVQRGGKMLKTQVNKEFLDLFYHEIENYGLKDCSATINLHVLKMKNNEFDYFSLVQSLFDSIVSFSLSKKEQEDMKDKVGQMFVQATSRLRKYESNEGELGEILLYCLLESHLNAPKIFTKLELKTSSNDYVKGADGVHLLKLDDQTFQLVFGESKLVSDLRDALYQAFVSINDFLTREDNNLNQEITLLSSHLQQEAITKDMYDYLKKIIIPQPKDEIETDNAFSIFIGFDLQLDEQTKKLSNHEFRREVRKQIKQSIEKEFNYIEKKIKDYDLHGYSLYVYCIPFLNLQTVRKKIIQCLKGANNVF